MLIARFSVRGNITAIGSSAYARVQLTGLPASGFAANDSMAVIREYGGAFAQNPILAVVGEESNEKFVSFQKDGTSAASWKVANSLYCAGTVILFK